MIRAGEQAARTGCQLIRSVFDVSRAGGKLFRAGFQRACAACHLIRTVAQRTDAVCEVLGFRQKRIEAVIQRLGSVQKLVHRIGQLVHGGDELLQGVGVLLVIILEQVVCNKGIYGAKGKVLCIRSDCHVIGDRQIQLLRERQAFAHAGEGIAHDHGAGPVIHQLAVLYGHVGEMLVVQQKGGQGQEGDAELFLLAADFLYGPGVICIVDPDLDSAAFPGKLLRSDLPSVQPIGEAHIHRQVLLFLRLCYALFPVRFPDAVADDNVFHGTGGICQHIHSFVIGDCIGRQFRLCGSFRCFRGLFPAVVGIGDADTAQYQRQAQNKGQNAISLGFHTKTPSLRSLRSLLLRLERFL